MGSIERRLKELEGKVPPNPCPACGGWFAVRLNGELDTLSRHGISADEHQRAEYLEHKRKTERNEGKCPSCRQAPLEIRIPVKRDTSVR